MIVAEIITGEVANKSFAILHSQKNGFCEFENGGVFQYQPLNDEGVCVVDSVAGFVLNKTVQPTSKYFTGGGNILDFTNAGTNTDVPEITDYEFGSEPVELNNRLWVQPVIVGGEKIGERFAAYNKNEPAPTGACFNQNAKWSDLLDYREIDADGTFLINEDGSYEINKYW